MPLLPSRGRGLGTRLGRPSSIVTECGSHEEIAMRMANLHMQEKFMFIKRCNT